MKIDVSFTEAHDKHICLVLEKKSSWDDFPFYLDKWRKLLSFEVLNEVNSVDERIAQVKLDNKMFWITYDDFQSSIQLEPCEGNEDEYLRKLAKLLVSGEFFTKLKQ